MADFDPVAHISSVMQGFQGQGRKFGLRVTDEPLEQKVGGRPSERIWRNGTPTDRLLKGTSAIGVRSSDPEDVKEALRKLSPSEHRYYYGQHVHLIHGNDYHNGTDEGERIIHGAKLAASYEKKDSGPGDPVRLAAQPGGQ